MPKRIKESWGTGESAKGPSGGSGEAWGTPERAQRNPRKEREGLGSLEGRTKREGGTPRGHREAQGVGAERPGGPRKISGRPGGRGAKALQAPFWCPAPGLYPVPRHQSSPAPGP